jgi:hypothetical protein
MVNKKSIQVALTTRISVVFGIIGKYDSKDKNILASPIQLMKINLTYFSI